MNGSRSWLGVKFEMWKDHYHGERVLNDNFVKDIGVERFDSIHVHWSDLHGGG